MEQLYSAHGVRFRFPAEWQLSEQRTTTGVHITVSSPETSFWSLTLLFDTPRPEDVIESALDAFREEYAELDIYSSEAALCHRRNVACDLEFICFELINSAFLRSFRTERFTVLVLFQGTDCELEHTREVLEAISESLQCDLPEASAGIQGDE